MACNKNNTITLAAVWASTRHRGARAPWRDHQRQAGACGRIINANTRRTRLLAQQRHSTAATLQHALNQHHLLRACLRHRVSRYYQAWRGAISATTLIFSISPQLYLRARKPARQPLARKNILREANGETTSRGGVTRACARAKNIAETYSASRSKQLSAWHRMWRRRGSGGSGTTRRNSTRI